jgi:hypothetical protein
LIQPSNRYYNPSNQHVIQQALQRKSSSQISNFNLRTAYALRALWPAEEVAIETRKRNKQSKNKFPIYTNTDLFKNTQKSLKLVFEFATKNTDLLTRAFGN